MMESEGNVPEARRLIFFAGGIGLFFRFGGIVRELGLLDEIPDA
jgi:hypothetical protein